jgi:hypothetical protein
MPFFTVESKFFIGERHSKEITLFKHFSITSTATARMPTKSSMDGHRSCGPKNKDTTGRNQTRDMRFSNFARSHRVLIRRIYRGRSPCEIGL